MSEDKKPESVRVYLPWLGASVIITCESIDEASKYWIDAAANWQKRAVTAEQNADDYLKRALAAEHKLDQIDRLFRP